MVYKLSDLDPKIRPTQLTVEDIDKITTAYKYLMEKHPEISSYDHRVSKRILNRKYTKILSLNEFTEWKKNNSYIKFRLTAIGLGKSFRIYVPCFILFSRKNVVYYNRFIISIETAYVYKIYTYIHEYGLAFK